VATLKKVSAAPPPMPASSPSSPLSPPGAANGGDLNQALKSSLDRYRQFVQDEEEDDMDEWDE
jgi:hypothetical protein